MRKVFIIEGIDGVKVNLPSDGYQEKFTVGRYTVKGILFPNGGYNFYIFQGDVMKAIIGSGDWYISRLDGEGQNLLNRLMKIFG